LDDEKCDSARQQMKDLGEVNAENVCEWIADIYKQEKYFLGIIERNLGKCQDKVTCSEQVFWETLKNVSTKNKSEVETAEGYFLRSAKRHAWKYPASCTFCSHTAIDDENILEAIYNKLQNSSPQTEWLLNFAILLKEFRARISREEWIFFDLAFCKGCSDAELERALDDGFGMVLKPAAIRQRRHRIKLKFIDFYKEKERETTEFNQIAHKVLVNN
jgi:hypothetical protein